MSIDGVALKEFDYVDIGALLETSGAVPVVTTAGAHQPMSPARHAATPKTLAHFRAYATFRIEAAQFLPHSGVRFPQNPCITCPYVGLCLGKQDLVTASLVRRPGDDRGLFDELDY